ncbi:MAG: DUF4349 domain-containing protein [Candidatus Woesearchaeota archaeon]
MEEKSFLQKYWWIFLVVLIIVVIFGLGFFGLMGFGMTSSSKAFGNSYYDENSYSEASYARDISQYLSVVSNDDFAPEIRDRQLIKTSNIVVETKRGQFFETQTGVNNIIKSSGAIVLSENFQTLGTGNQKYNVNSYQIKIETSKYDSVAAQLRDIGGVVSFSESATDITGAISDINVEIASEKERLKRYEQLVSTTASLNDKILLTDRIFEQDRRIKYLEDRLQNSKQDVAYSTITLRLQEQPPALYGVALVGIGKLFKTMVGSLNALLYFVSAVLPWILAIGIIFFIGRWIMRLVKG